MQQKNGMYHHYQYLLLYRQWHKCEIYKMYSKNAMQNNQIKLPLSCLYIIRPWRYFSGGTANLQAPEKI